MTPCEKRNWEVGQVFEVIERYHISLNAGSKGSIFVLSRDDGGYQPLFDLIKGDCDYDLGKKTKKGAYLPLHKVKRIYPPEEESKEVEITCEGKTVKISRESAKALNLC